MDSVESIKNTANMVDSLNLTPIQQFYTGTNIFITGGSGFMGHILLEKLLRSCPTISSIYMLIRSKKGKDLHTRTDEIFDNELFDKLRSECPKFRHKIIPVNGDCSLPNLGLDLQDRKMLIDKIDIIFHAAATVRFDEKLKLAVTINVRAVRDIIALSKEMVNLKSFIHISTAFSNCPRKMIEEKMYPPPISGHDLINLAESNTDEYLDELTPKLIGEWPNTYAFTKCIAEDILNTEASGLPLGVCRPAIVISTYKEPTPGWINNFYGPTGVAAGAGAGLLRVLQVDAKKDASLVPVDMCVNAMIAAAWEVHDEYQRCKEEKQAFEFPVYNYVSGNDQPISWGRFMALTEKYGVPLLSSKAIWCYSLTLQKNYMLYMISVLFLHFLPAILLDGVLLCIGKKPKLVKAYKKIYKFSSVIAYFATREWKFESSRVRKLIDRMTDRDKTIFCADMKLLDWEEYYVTYTQGVRIHILQDPLDTLPLARARTARFYYAHQTLKVIFAYFVIRFIWFCISSIFF